MSVDKIQKARSLRHSMTDAERKLWSRLRAGRIGYKFRRQVPIGAYIADFLCYESKLVIEVDGSQHRASGKDAVRDEWLTAQGFQVMRFWNNDVLLWTDDVLKSIWNAARTPSPQPSPVKGEGVEKTLNTKKGR
jgi:2-isopropylmalate synthase